MNNTFTDIELTAIRKIFDQFDKDSSNSIETSELSTLCIALNNPLGPPELQDAFRTLDIDKNGCISWKEFIKYWETN